VSGWNGNGAPGWGGVDLGALHCSAMDSKREVLQLRRPLPPARPSLTHIPPLPLAAPCSPLAPPVCPLLTHTPHLPYSLPPPPSTTRGPPGTGKTSFIKALAQLTRRSIVNIPLARIRTNQELMDLMFAQSVQVCGCVGVGGGGGATGWAGG
jgi:hypothetical protein